MLPNIYPAFPDVTEFDIYATMTPAKEVGGDFYDFFLIDEDHLGMVMADVSGKGVPAALFMMISKIIINNYAMQGLSPAKVLEQTNALICRNNDEDMFVTVWFGVLELSTGVITASNAGHEYPIVRKANGDFELYKDKHGFVIGGMEGMKYKEYQITIEKGGSLFLYTDGVPEATNGEKVLFGTDRLIEALNKHKDCSVTDLLKNIKAEVDGFVGDAEQFDDLTMLGLTYMG
jgi:sigma-B regulation protein RsbU (phosphoserine phosphatase)